MKFSSDYKFQFVEGIQFINGLYETDKEEEIKILKRYADSVHVVVDEVEKVAIDDAVNEVVEDKTSTTKSKAKKTNK